MADLSGTAGPSIQIGYPAGEKQLGQRADFLNPNRFDSLIEMHGYRLAWSRACVCPCAPLNAQTEQADPSCPDCAGAGYLYFTANPGAANPAAGELSEVQQAIIASSGATVIRGILTGMGQSETPYDRLGRLPSGQCVVTVRPYNRIGYLDRLIALDSYVIHTERAYYPARDDLTVPLRYLVDGGVNLLRSSTQTFVPDVDFEVVAGKVRFLPGRGPAYGSYLAAHYNCHPHYLVMEQPHASRVTYLPRGKTGLATPEGNVTQLPLQAVLRLDWLVGRDEARTLA